MSSNVVNKCNYIKTTAAISTMQRRSQRQKRDFFGIVLYFCPVLLIFYIRLPVSVAYGPMWFLSLEMGTEGGGNRGLFCLLVF